MATHKKKRVQHREERTGRFGFTGKFSRLCTCGHPLGVHAGEPPHPCFDEDTGAGGTGSDCRCSKFVLARRRKSSK